VVGTLETEEDRVHGEGSVAPIARRPCVSIGRAVATASGYQAPGGTSSLGERGRSSLAS
jgi:hypothetical protein